MTRRKSLAEAHADAHAALAQLWWAVADAWLVPVTRWLARLVEKTHRGP